MANLSQRTSVAVPPFEITELLLFSGGWMSWEWGEDTKPHRNLQAEVQHPAPPFQCVLQEQLYGATVPWTCLQAQSTREMLDEFRSGKNNCEYSLPRDWCGIQAWFQAQQGGAGNVGVPTLWAGQAPAPCPSVPFPQAAASGWPRRKAALSKDVLSQFILLLLFLNCNSVWCG